jgi:hypothetical protein
MEDQWNKHERNEVEMTKDVWVGMKGKKRVGFARLGS